MAEELTRLRRRRGIIKRKLTNFVSYLAPIQTIVTNSGQISDKSLKELQFRFDKLEPLLSEFEGVQ